MPLVNYKKYIVIALSCLLVVGAVTAARSNSADPQVDILEETVTTKPTETTAPTETTEQTEFTESTLPTETTVSTEPTTAPTTEPTEITTPTTYTEVTEPPETEPAIDEYTKGLLACVIYQEAGSDDICDECRYRVADVVLNRVEDPRFPNTVYDVLTAPRQYGEFYWTGVIWPERAGASTEEHAVDRAYAVAEDVLSGNHSDLYGQGYIWQAEFSQGYDVIYCCGNYFGK